MEVNSPVGVQTRAEKIKKNVLGDVPLALSGQQMAQRDLEDFAAKQQLEAIAKKVSQRVGQMETAKGVKKEVNTVIDSALASKGLQPIPTPAATRQSK